MKRALPWLVLLCAGVARAQTPEVAIFGGERGLEEGLDQQARQGRTNHPRSQAHHVDVVMLDRLKRRVAVVTHRRAHARELAGGDGHARAAAADDDAAVGLAVPDGGRHCLGNIRVVHGRAGVGAQVDDFVPLLGHHAGQIAFHLESGVIGANRNSHRQILAGLTRAGEAGGAGRAGRAAPPHWPHRPSYTVNMHDKPSRWGVGLAAALLATAGLAAQGTPAQQKPLLAVSPDAIVQHDGRSVVYVVRDGHAVAVPVTPGAKVGDVTAISGDVKSGEKAVAKPAPSLANGALVKTAAK